MIIDEDKLILECTCANRCSHVTIEQFEDDFILNVFRKYAFKHKKEVEELVFDKHQAQQIINYLQRKMRKNDQN